jgi:hypothetical protein
MSPRSDVDTPVWHRLPRSGTDVDTDILTVELQLVVKPHLEAVDPLPDRGIVCHCGIEAGRCVAMWYHQTRSGIERVPVLTNKRQLILDNRPGFPAKGAIGVFVDSIQNPTSPRRVVDNKNSIILRAPKRLPVTDAAATAAAESLLNLSQRTHLPAGQVSRTAFTQPSVTGILMRGLKLRPSPVAPLVGGAPSNHSEQDRHTDKGARGALVMLISTQLSTDPPSPPGWSGPLCHRHLRRLRAAH